MRKAQNAEQAEGSRQRGDRADGVPSQNIRTYRYQQTGAYVNNNKRKSHRKLTQQPIPSQAKSWTILEAGHKAAIVRTPTSDA